jgi:hypothetical protein
VPHLDELNVIAVEGFVGNEEIVGGGKPVPIRVQHLLVDAANTQERIYRFYRLVFSTFTLMLQTHKSGFTGFTGLCSAPSR